MTNNSLGQPDPSQHQSWNSSSPTGDSTGDGGKNGKAARLAMIVLAIIAIIAITAGVTWALTNNSDSADSTDVDAFVPVTTSQEETEYAEGPSPEAAQTGKEDEDAAAEKPGPATKTTTETQIRSDQSTGNDQCDGRYIMIVESAIIPVGEDPSAETQRVQNKYPGSKILSGNACSSLRGQVDGGTAYAIYFDAGHSVDKVCELKATSGGNARSLNNNADFSDPC
ncbi:hypothetical protein ABRP87_06330 [Corynebacterium sp. KPL2830]|uniref:hypothetical protein n=1 Tax=Corynebacterium sp. KPL2830 TaxID=3158315 RepID=UPI0032EBCCBE